MNSNRARVLITMGDPSGIGPEVVIKALSDKHVTQSSHITVIGDYLILDKVKKGLRSKTEFSLSDLSNVPSRGFSFGQSEPSFGKASIEYIDKALEMIKKNEADALVTAPVNKASVRLAGFNDFEGHTGYISSKTGVKDFAMMFVGKQLKITLVTRHVALKDVAGRLTEEAIYKTVILTDACLRNFFGIKDAKIGVAALNPHAGDRGLFGDEEARVIIPAIKKASGKISGVYGPVAADVLYHEAINGKFDACVAMYHDQALAPFKMLYFKDGVNMTLGLPFIRTSPDHGTAFDIAGKWVADATSMKEAIVLASRLASRKQ